MIFLCDVLNNLSVVGCIGERLVCGLIGNSGQSGEGLWHQVGRLHDDHGDDDPVLYNVKSNNSIDKGKS